MPTIETFGEHHISEALKLWRSTEHIGLSRDDEPEALRIFLARNPGLSFVAIDNHIIVGAVLCGHDGRRGYIHHIAVAMSHRRQRLGKRLMEQALQALVQARITKCHALVFRNNPHGRLFWAPEGWELRNDLCVYSKRQ